MQAAKLGNHVEDREIRENSNNMNKEVERKMTKQQKMMLKGILNRVGQ